jgi:hypothetical protein
VDVRHVVLDLAAAADGADRCALGDAVAAAHANRAEVRQRHREPVARLNRDAFAAIRDRPGEGNCPARRRCDVGAVLGADVDTAVLSGCVGVVPEDELLDDRAVDGPGPGPGRRRRDNGREQRGGETQAHDNSSVVLIVNIYGRR